MGNAMTKAVGLHASAACDAHTCWLSWAGAYWAATHASRHIPLSCSHARGPAGLVSALQLELLAYAHARRSLTCRLCPPPPPPQPQLLGHIKKDKQGDALVEKLCQRFGATEEPAQWHNLAFCMTQVGGSACEGCRCRCG